MSTEHTKHRTASSAWTPTALERARHHALDLAHWLLPPVCVCCAQRIACTELSREHTEGSQWQPGMAAPAGWCWRCAFHLLANEHGSRCVQCGERGLQTRCRRCRRMPPGFDATLVLADYAPPLDRLVHAIKYGRRAAPARALGRLLAHRALQYMSGEASHFLGQPSASWIVSAVPLTPARLAERGFNQALLLAAPVSRALGAPLQPQLLCRLPGGRPAASLHARERHRLLRTAFRVETVSHCRGRPVLMVDDVMTTGATLRSIATVLRQAGASRVVNLVAARTARAPC